MQLLTVLTLLWCYSLLTKTVDFTTSTTDTFLSPDPIINF